MQQSAIEILRATILSRQLTVILIRTLQPCYYASETYMMPEPETDEELRVARACLERDALELERKNAELRRRIAELELRISGITSYVSQGQA